MFARQQNQNALDPPPIAQSDSSAVEVLRVWVAPGQSQQLTLKSTWKDSGAWGLLLVDVARHAAEAYALEGHDRAAVLARIKALFDAEWSSPTDTPRNVPPQ
ncbi:MAG: DUF5076 domain-containing protein [Terriglobales bacterium]